MSKTVITGINTICSLGIGFDRLKKNIAKEILPTKIQAFEMYDLPSEQYVYTAPDFEPKDILGKKGLRTLDNSTKILMSAIELGFKEYLEGLSEEERPGLMVGTAFGSVESIGNFITDSIRFGVNSVNPGLFGNSVINSPAGNSNIRYGIKSLSGTLTSGLTSGLEGLIYTCDHITQGYLPSILYAGLEEVSAYQYAAAIVEDCLAKDEKIRPFSQTPQGYILGEGVAVMLVESEKFANKHSRKAIASIEGYSSGFDPNGGKFGYNAKGDVMEYVVREAIRKARIKTEDIAFVSASANSTSGDLVEARVISRVFGEETPVACYKQKFGEAWGASGALSVAATIADLQKKRVSPIYTDGYSKVDGINLVRKQEFPIDKDYALVLSCAPDGNCAAVVIKNINNKK
jgi:3-oxoacyl-(acyl-carrier-protein) synthase